MDRLIRREELAPDSGQMVHLRKGEQMPEGARLMTADEVLEMQMKTIMNWKPRSEMWPFSWGLGLLGSGAAISAVFINNFCRRKLGLMNLGRMATYAPTVALPVILGSFYHKVLVTDKILKGDFPCTVCAATRSGAIQSATAGIYPMILGPLVCTALARKYHTYPVPSIRNLDEVIPFMRRTVPVTGTCLLIVLANFMLGMAIAERETFLFAKHLSPSSSSLMKEDKGFSWGE